MRNITKLFLLFGLLFGSMVGFAGTASAHTPAISASCEGVNLSASAYDGKKANTYTVTVNGVTQSGTFGSSFSKSIPVPQAGATSTYSATIKAFNGQYAKSASGTVGPCGKPAPIQPPDKVDVGGYTDVPNCEDNTTTFSRTITTTPYVLNAAGDAYVLGTPVEKVESGTREALRVECPKPEQPVKEDVVSYSNPIVDCKVGVVTVTKTVTSFTYTYDEKTNKFTESSNDVVTEETYESSEVECPVTPPTDPVPPVVVDPPVTDTPAPTPEVTEPTPSVDTPKRTVSAPAEPVKREAVLPNTGGAHLSIFAAGMGLLLIGGGMIVARRKFL